MTLSESEGVQANPRSIFEEPRIFINNYNSSLAQKAMNSRMIGGRNLLIRIHNDEASEEKLFDEDMIPFSEIETNIPTI